MILTDEQDHPWHCDEHNLDAIFEEGSGYRCPECNKIIEENWEEFSRGPKSNGNFELSDWYEHKKNKK